MNWTRRIQIARIVPALWLVFQGCAPSAEASTNLDLSDLPRLLTMIETLTKEGFGEKEVALVKSTARSMKVNEVWRHSFVVKNRDTKTTLRVQLKKDDVDAVSIYFFTETTVAADIRESMKRILR